MLTSGHIGVGSIVNLNNAQVREHILREHIVSEHLLREHILREQLLREHILDSQPQ